ncbi:hypothetical protein [Rhizobium oryzicola]|uniref:Molecular chaperone DnaJ n=1 Tax=Rhizobium oryzicola TaxID=1232668 RepID=A0ABT8SVQ5_9HYPH|nr:hypothetical protein [Rhizobium oryzicola]MDO1581782.1 hypothetical protein [Rhizobium oryzicola]
MADTVNHEDKSDNPDEVPAGMPASGENACRHCGGSGKIGTDPCPECNGTGIVVTPIGGAG